MNELSLHKQDTAVLKGIAILAMLVHHMYGAPPPDVAPYGGIFEWIGVLGKVCVALFLFCSGYGLAANFIPTSIKDDLKFIARRLVKFYLNYWVIFLIFVPITIFCFHRPLSAAYGEYNVWCHLMLDIFGVQGWHSYNVTWWFNALIIILYLLFPLIYRMINFKPWFFVVLSAALMRYADHIPYNPMDLDIYLWQFPFVVGIIWKSYEIKGASIQKWFTEHKCMTIILTISMLCFVVAARMYPIIPHWHGLRIDGFLSCAIALCVVFVLRPMSHVMNMLALLGRHSMNIYLMHTFINWYWCREWLHSCEWLRGGVNIAILMLICLAVSITLEYIKEKVGFYKLINSLNINRSTLHNI